MTNGLIIFIVGLIILIYVNGGIIGKTPQTLTMGLEAYTWALFCGIVMLYFIQKLDFRFRNKLGKNQNKS